MAVGTKAQSLQSAIEPFGPVPGPDDLTAIHRLSLEPVDAASLYVRRMALANTRLDRSYEQFTVPVLQRLADTLVGKSLLIAHQKYGLATGLFYRAAVVKAADGESDLFAYFYLPVVPATEEVRQLIDAGVVRYASIGFTYDERYCSVCDEDYWACPHVPGDMIRPSDGHPGGKQVTFVYGGDLAKYEACEGSLVYLGAQIGAQITKEFVAMENEKALARIKELEAELRAAGDRLVSLPKLEEERDRLTQERDGYHEQLKSAQTLAAHNLPDSESKALVEDGKLYRADLRAEVSRLAGIVKTEAEASLLLTALPLAPAAQLKELAASYQARCDEKFPPRPVGEPAAPGVDPAAPVSPVTGVGAARPLRIG